MREPQATETRLRARRDAALQLLLTLLWIPVCLFSVARLKWLLIATKALRKAAHDARKTIGFTLIPCLSFSPLPNLAALLGMSSVCWASRARRLKTRIAKECLITRRAPFGSRMKGTPLFFGEEASSGKATSPAASLRGSRGRSVPGRLLANVRYV